ncbi:G patch domain-containing protein 1, partial [Tremellales sp. Uapishka_1]
MTSRLKHKLELDNVNLNSAYLNESFVQVGTPLPALANTKKDQLEYVPVWKQEVRDEQGRRRLHGAFTGGFSAGYYNTVGSKEGWAPSTFKSSRNARASKTQRPEDFMDDEDIQQMKEDRKLENTETFKGEGVGSTSEELANKGLPSALESLIAPTRSSIGSKLLQKLGWRPGQGIGPRVTLRKLRIQEQKLGRPISDIEEGDVKGKTFAPRDTKLLVFDNKDGKEGLGFQKGSGMGSLPKKEHVGPAFGVGYVDGEEDDDPYSTGSTSQAGRFAFESNNADDDNIIIMGEKPGARAGLGSKGKAREDTTASVGKGDRWHDGRPMLAGFVLDVRRVQPDKWFAMPDIPAEWRPRPARVWGTIKKWDETPADRPAEKEIIRGAPGRPLTFEQRGAALGEEQRKAAAKSVFDYMSEKDRERIAAFTSSRPPPPQPLSMTEEPDSQTVQSRPPAESVVVPPLSPRTASAALKGFIPFGDDPSKQDRYRSYLSSQTIHTKTPQPTLLPTASLDDINKELEDFAQSARIFKPMSFALANRFTSASPSLAISDSKAPKPGLHLYDSSRFQQAKEISEVKPAEDDSHLSPRELAAKMGNHGTLTRRMNEFYPVKLLCKRFGVQDPHPEGEPPKSVSGGGGGSLGSASGLPKNDASWQDGFIHQEGTDRNVPSSSNGAVSHSLVGVLEHNQEHVPKTLGEVGMAEDVNQGRDTLSYKKPDIDIFKAIFASDDEDDEDEVEAVATGSVVESQEAEEKPADPFPVAEAPMDIKSFKPIFQKKSEEDTKKKKKDKVKKRKGVLSFDVGDEEEEEDAVGEKERRKKKVKVKVEAKAKVDEVEDEDGGEWVEKTVIVPKMGMRKGAADYM